ncbi:MAG TPA: ABC transporter permease [Thermoanaerobaculia bacterium]|nr:ABC transporter permease [Thermoanaerobaculia bacterium]
MNGVAQDLRYAVRGLARNPGFAALATLTLGLGIGANTALFSVAHAALLRQLPVREPGRLVLFEWRAGETFRTSGRRGSGMPLPPHTTGASVFRPDVYARLEEARTGAGAKSSPLQTLFGFAPIYELTSRVGDRAEIVHGQAVTGNYFEGLGVRPALGRPIVESDDRPGAAPVAVVSHAFWKSAFGADPSVLGKVVTLNRTAFTVVGVTPPEFAGTLQVDYQPAVTVPLSCEPVLLGADSGLRPNGRPTLWFLNVMGRLKPGATLDEARQSLDPTFRAAALEVMPPPRRDGEPARLEPKDEPRLTTRPGGLGLMESRQMYSRPIYALFGVVGVVLLIACANLANLLLARATRRRGEIRTRLAIGASRGRLIRQLLTESLLIAMLGGLAGILFALWGDGALAAISGEDARILPNGVSAGLSAPVIAFAIALTVVTSLLFGLVPAWGTSRVDLSRELAQSRRTASRSRLGGGLIVLQVALSVVLLSGAGLLLRTLHNLQAVPLGFDQERLLVFGLRPEQGGYREERLAQFYDALLARLDALPGVAAVTFGRIPLIAEYSWNTNVLLPGESVRSAAHHVVNRQMVRENYFDALRIPKLRGRTFTAGDDERAPRVAIVNATLARRLFPGGDPIGQRISDPDEKWQAEIVGVVGDTKYDSQRSAVEPLLYTPWRQDLRNVGEMYFALRAAEDPAALTPTVERAVHDLDRGLPLTDVGTQEERSRATVGRERIYTQILTFFGGLALLLAATGLFGVLAYSVAQRTREIGIRMALGARQANVVRMIVAQGLRPAAAGLVLGLGAALALGRTVADLVYGIPASDPGTLAGVGALLLGIAGLAAFIPARRAARVDPSVALRSD